MFDSKFFEKLSKDLVGLVPKGAATTFDDLQKNFKSLLQNNLNKLDLVTREEFDAQTQVLKRTREKLDAIEKRLEQENR